MADKKAAKLRRREIKQAREQEKSDRTGQSPAELAEAERERETDADAELREAERRMGLDGSVGGDTATGRRTRPV